MSEYRSVRSEVPTNYELAALALLRVGGDTTRRHTEFVAKELKDMVPGRFRWRHFPEEVSLELVRTALSDAMKSKCGSLVIGSHRSGWMLTEEGRRRAAELESHLTSGLLLPRRSRSDEKRLREESARILNSAAYRDYLAIGEGAIGLRSSLELFHLSEYIRGEPRERKIRSLMALFEGEPEILECLRVAAMCLEENRE